MAGHSKWANIKHKKEKSDKKKGKEFSRIAKEIISAVKQGGGDPKTNSKLRLVIQKAKAANLPSENIEKNIKKASSKDQSDFFELNYELYGHGGVGIIVQAMTDNKNRLSSEMRIATNKCGGTVASPGSVSFNFDHKGVIQIKNDQAEEDELFLIATEAGAQDFDSEDDLYIITTAPEDLYKIKQILEESEISILNSSLEMIPKNYVSCSKSHIEANNRLIEWLENLDDVDAIFHNMDLEDTLDK
jgi:YebC/PmpR family DNA-binding regulatory protein